MELKLIVRRDGLGLDLVSPKRWYAGMFLGFSPTRWASLARDPGWFYGASLGPISARVAIAGRS